VAASCMRKLSPWTCGRYPPRPRSVQQNHAGVESLGAADTLRCTRPLKPRPLFDVLALRGFSHRPVSWRPAIGSVLRTRPSARALPFRRQRLSPVARRRRAAGEVEVDARGLEPPEPWSLSSRRWRRCRPAPCSRPEPIGGRCIYTRSCERGFTGVSEEQPDGSFVTSIRRAG